MDTLHVFQNYSKRNERENYKKKKKRKEREKRIFLLRKYEQIQNYL